MSANHQLRIVNMNRFRVELFGNETLKLFETTPETGETEFAELEDNWRGHRVVKTTDGGAADSGAWQFEIAANADWGTSQTSFYKIVSFSVGDRRWKIQKLEKPIGNSLVWKIKAQIQ